MPSSPWWRGRLCAFDCETTGVNVEEDRIVTAAVVVVGGGEPLGSLTLTADPGVEIPEAAAAIHGVTTERAQAEGRPAHEVVAVLREALGTAIAQGHPLVVMNARFDLSILDRELRRYGLDALPPPRVVDPFVLDKHLDRYRKSYPPGITAEQAAERGIPSTRTLTGMCAHYAQKWEATSGKPVPALLSEAHDADADALAAARLAWIIGALPPKTALVRRVRNAEEGREKAALIREWTEVREDLDRLHAFQRRIALAERDRFAEYKASQGEHEEAARIAAEKGWPVLELPVTA